MSSSPTTRRTSSIQTSPSAKIHQSPVGGLLNNANFPPPSATSPSATLGHLPRKPATIANNSRNSSVVGVLNPNVGGNNGPASPNSGGFGKGGLGFRRVGVESSNAISTTAPVQPYLMDQRKKASSANVPSSPVMGVAVNGTIGRGPPPLPTTAAPHPARRLGSFNSLAVTHNNPPLTNNSKEVGKLGEDKGRPQNDHPLRFEWVFWVLHRAPTKKMSEEEFGRAMRRLGSCDTVETFYPLYLHIKRPSIQTPIADIHLFINPIKPVWEDPSNVKGGKWTIRLRKGLSDRLWESLVLSLIGGSLEKLVDGQGLGDGGGQEICGAVLSIRRDEDIMSVWHRTGDPDLAGDGKMAKKVKLSVQTVLQLPLNCNLVYKLNADSLANGHHLAQKQAQQHAQQQQQQQQSSENYLKNASQHRIHRPMTKKREAAAVGAGDNFGIH